MIGKRPGDIYPPHQILNHSVLGDPVSTILCSSCSLLSPAVVAHDELTVQRAVCSEMLSCSPEPVCQFKPVSPFSSELFIQYMESIKLWCCLF